MTEGPNYDPDLLRAYAEIAERRARRISELVSELEARHRPEVSEERDLRRRLDALEKENAQLREQLTAARGSLSRLNALLLVRAGRRIHRVVRRVTRR